MATKNKYWLSKIIIKDFESRGYVVKSRVKKPTVKSNPMFELSKGGKSSYFYICEAALKPSKTNHVFSGITPGNQRRFTISKTYWTIIDFRPEKPRFIFSKMDEMGYHFNANGYLLVSLKRPEYNGIFNTNNVGELKEKVRKIIG
jgi:hypothetical protein